jgi:hypothetical protein
MKQNQILAIGLLSWLPYYVTAHAFEHNVYDLSNIRMLGSKSFMESYKAKRSSIIGTSKSKQLVRRLQNSPNVNKHKKCGPGVGKCDPNDWYVDRPSHCSLTALWAKLSSPVALQEEIVDEGTTTALVQHVNLTTQTDAMPIKNHSATLPLSSPDHC